MMPNKNYQRGRAKEYRVKKKLEDAGLYVVRTAGSHGVCDLVAFGANKLVIPIQVKPKGGYISPMEKRKIMQFEAKTGLKVAIE